MKITATSLPEVLVVEPQCFADPRGHFLETHQQARYASSGMDVTFVQDNLSLSQGGALRGLHYQLRRPQAKLVYVAQGSIFDVVVDIRHGSPFFGQWTGTELSEENHLQQFVPVGFAHGFCVLSSQAVVIYKCSDYYVPQDEGGILWSDAQLAIAWPVAQPLVSDKDAALPPLAQVPRERLFTYRQA